MSDEQRGSDLNFLKFPDGFIWSAATASYQVEGGWKEDDKGESIWDVFSHKPGNVLRDENGDIACDSYHKIAEDIEALKQIGVSHYRFSLSWPRILPNGSNETINEKGVDYYNRLINALLSNNIQPVVTLFHWDLPQCLQEKFGGWLSKDIIKYFVDYADICFESFGDRVKWWVTINEPIVISSMGYGMGKMAPGIKNAFGFSFEASHHLTLAHAEVWHLYEDKYRSLQKGKVGLSLFCDWAEPYTKQDEDIEAAKGLMETRLGLFCDPVCNDGDYSDFIKERFETLKKLGIIPADVFMPKFGAEEKMRNKGSYDFLGLNYYSSKFYKTMQDGHQPDDVLPFLSQLAKAEGVIDPSWKSTVFPWLYSVPWGLRKLLKFLKDSYGNPPIYILENGFPDSDGRLDDEERVEYLQSHLKAVFQAITRDEVNVIGYTVWSLMDNFEWSMGYGTRFGLFRVDQGDPERRRVAKKSVEFYAKVVGRNGLLSE